MFLRNDGNRVRNYVTQYRSLNTYSRENPESYAVIYFVIIITACAIASNTEGRHIPHPVLLFLQDGQWPDETLHLCCQMLDNELPIIIHVLRDPCLVKLFYLLLNE